MASFPFHNELLAPFLALPQGEKVQAECELGDPLSYLTYSPEFRCLDRW